MSFFNTNEQFQKTVLTNLEKIMATLTSLTAAFNQLQSDVNNLTTVVIPQVITDIQTAITLINADSPAAIAQLQTAVQNLDAATTPVTAALQSSDVSLQGAEGGGSSPATKTGTTTSTNSAKTS